MKEIDVLVTKIASVDQYLTTEVLEDIATSIKTDKFSLPDVESVICTS